MKRLVNIFFIVPLFCNSLYGQDISISLQELSTYAFKSNVDEIEKSISKYGFTFVGADTTTLNSSLYNWYSFKRVRSGLAEEISFYKEISPKIPFNITYRIIYSSLYSENYNNYKIEMDKDKSAKFIDEQISGNCFHRNYETTTFNYDFCICKTQYPDDPMHMVIINFNNFAGNRR